MFPVEFGVQRSSAPGVKVEIRFLSSMVPFPPRVTISHMDYPWEEDVPYRIQGPKVKCTEL
jgi:hypothetical protein